MANKPKKGKNFVLKFTVKLNWVFPVSQNYYFQFQDLAL